MGFKVKESATFDEKFKKLIQNGNYEQIIFQIMKDSKEVFPNQYEYITSQGNGECDFVEKGSGKKFDAKLPLTTEQGKLVGSRKGNLLKYCQSINKGLEEFGEYIESNDEDKFENITLYQRIKELIERDKSDENIIFLFTYPVVFDSGESSMILFVNDSLDYFFQALKKDGLTKNREIYVIYPNALRQLVLRRLNDDKREYIKDRYLSEYISYDMEILSKEE